MFWVLVFGADDCITLLTLTSMKQSIAYKHKKELFDIFDKLSRTQDRHRVFEDFITCAICCYHRTNLVTNLHFKDEENEALYQQTIKGYKKEELRLFGEALGHLSLQIDKHPYSDPLGEYYEEHFSNERLGQFFTPMEVCRAMAGMMIVDLESPPEEKTINDPCCGSGRLLLAYAELAPKNYFFANDISLTLAKLCTLNFFINGLQGEVCWGDSLKVEYKKVWRINMLGVGILPVPPEQSIGFSVQASQYQEKPSTQAKKVPIKVQHSETKPNTSEQLKLF
ncbi:hypothetical protein AD998_07575 [bacterium 336/3]|nr:hypothetical protein AD998_07575 [bacterium 336/3]